MNHGLQAAAPSFEAHCRTVCAALGLTIRVAHPDARAARGESPEAAARNARYACFDALALSQQAPSAITTIALAHHADDQVETVLLALSRGAGVAGLAGMPARWERGALILHRPLLAVSGADIRSWLSSRPEIGWVDDPTNQQESFTRNRIRARLAPVLESSFPAFRQTFARSAAHAAEAQSVLNEVALHDLAVVGEPPVIACLQTLSSGRMALVLRVWLRRTHGTTPEARQLAELERQIRRCITRGHRIDLKVGAGMVRRSGATLDWYNPAALPGTGRRPVEEPSGGPPIRFD